MFAQNHPATKGLLNKSILYYDDLSCVFGKDRATGAHTDLYDLGLNVPGGYDDEFRIDDANDPKIPIMYSKGLDMSLDKIMGTQHGRSNEGRNASSKSKRKQGEKTAEVVDIIAV